MSISQKSELRYRYNPILHMIKTAGELLIKGNILNANVLLKLINDDFKANLNFIDDELVYKDFVDYLLMINAAKINAIKLDHEKLEVIQNLIRIVNNLQKTRYYMLVGDIKNELNQYKESLLLETRGGGRKHNKKTTRKKRVKKQKKSRRK